MVVQYTKKDGKLVEAKLLLVEEKDLKDGCKLTIPEGITVIGSSAFRKIKRKNIVTNRYLKIKMPDTVKEIEKLAFLGLTIQKIRFSKNLRKIGERAFQSTVFLGDLNLPNSLTNIPEECFKSCKFNGEVKLPDELTTIGSRAFSKATFQNKLVIPKKVKKIPFYCFESSFFPNGMELPSGLMKIDDHAFECSDIEELKVPDSVTDIGIECFNQSGIRRIKLSKNLTCIPQKSFFFTTFLKSIDIPSQVTTIKSHAFAKSSLSEVTLSNGLQVIGDSAFQGTELRNIQIPTSVYSINERSFYNCSKLQGIDFPWPSALKKIGDRTFYNCALSGVTLPEKVTIGKEAFAKNLIQRIRLTEEEYNQIKSNGAFNENEKLNQIDIYNYKNQLGNEKKVSKRKVKRIGKRGL